MTTSTKPAPQPAAERPATPPKPAEDVPGHDHTVPDEDDHRQISRNDLEKGRPKNTGREGA
ncbi:hypothetical protein EDC65_2899 [Stella humosa]|uniref:Uncharacterized protein n=1 Tax=Stella humosa TaxID=94 RepID=A0A3N1LJQ0_9PROT|nr:hypothetical protein [Stella humosa]ROP91039.1 hypothetical protein EDC65_2899 [Stella humosa]BBK34611.1 hypothetical protein STHU_52450 [Stella humosa]